MSAEGSGEGLVANECADLDVALERGLGEVGRSDERPLLVGDDRFGVEDTALSLRIK
jgi:hypothetical protein